MHALSRAGHIVHHAEKFRRTETLSGKKVLCDATSTNTHVAADQQVRMRIYLETEQHLTKMVSGRQQPEILWLASAGGANRGL